MGCTYMNATMHTRLSIGESRLREGGAQLIHLTEGFNVWTKHMGPRRGTQVLTLHGGPGIPHFYLECLEDFLPRSGIGFWYYDQLGSYSPMSPPMSRSSRWAAIART
jgi:proline iminopeptidase